MRRRAITGRFGTEISSLHLPIASLIYLQTFFFYPPADMFSCFQHDSTVPLDSIFRKVECLMWVYIVVTYGVMHEVSYVAFPFEYTYKSDILLHLKPNIV